MDKEKFQIAIENFNPVLVTDQLAALNAKREAFVAYFTPEHIEGMPIEEYTIGYGNNGKHNFCYDLEHTLRGLGSIRGGSSKKFGVWYSAKENSYSYAKKYGSAQIAYEQIRKNILDLLVAGDADDIKAIMQIPLALVFKGKILSTYYPEKYLNIFTAEHLDYFLKSLDINDPAYSVEEKRVLLAKFKDSLPEMKDWSLQCFSRFLYEGYPKSPDVHLTEDIRLKKYRDFILNCTMSAKSVNNYTDFRRINECLQEIYPNTELTILDIDTAEEVAEIQKLLEKNDKFKQYNNKGGNQYTYTLIHYMHYLQAKELFTNSYDEDITSDLLPSNADKYTKYIRALRTKPFMLLAGISGTGKSRIVRELAFRSCPNRDDLRKDSTTPGNYLMVEVKPNWHDSTEILGFHSNLTKKYHFTKFIKFLVKAKKYSDVPFFVCLDEMNLAPVEQYFAEFLSVLETRKKNGNHVMTGSLVDAQYMNELEGWTEGNLTLPDNVFIIGTVNMDDTTHQFSRKVIDRAMTIEMNGGELSKMFGNDCDLAYPASDDDLWTMDDFRCSYVNADEVIKENPFREKKIKKQLSDKLTLINGNLKNTPYQISYRVLNELCVYLGHLLEKNPNVSDEDFDKMIDTAVDQITMMKILPRIEGDEDMFAIEKSEKNRLEKMMELFDPTTESYKKLEEMNNRLESGFTRFWP